MTAHDATPDPQRVRTMFEGIVARYDLMNRIMTLGRDRAWRRITVQALSIEPDSRVLDVGCGTGDLTLDLLRAEPGLAVGLDPVPAMLDAAGMKLATFDGRVALVQGDAQTLPFPGESLDIVASAFVMRNVADLPAVLAESFRVLRPGGRIGILELTPMRLPVLSQLFRLYFHLVVPILGGIITGDRAAYSYLPASVDRFPDAEDLAGMLDSAGFRLIRYRRLMFGTVALHIANRPGGPELFRR